MITVLASKARMIMVLANTATTITVLAITSQIIHTFAIYVLYDAAHVKRVKLCSSKYKMYESDDINSAVGVYFRTTCIPNVLAIIDNSLESVFNKELLLTKTKTNSPKSPSSSALLSNAYPCDVVNYSFHARHAFVYCRRGVYFHWQQWNSFMRVWR